MIHNVAIGGVEHEIGSGCEVRVECILFHVLFGADGAVSHCGLVLLGDRSAVERLWV